jgi:predicted dinucleotide-utilizing enzyme
MIVGARALTPPEAAAASQQRRRRDSAPAVRLQRTMSHLVASPQPPQPPRHHHRVVALIGCGAIGEAVARALLPRHPPSPAPAPPLPPLLDATAPGVDNAELAAVLVRDVAKYTWLQPPPPPLGSAAAPATPEAEEAGRPRLPAGVVVTADVEEWLAECARRGVGVVVEAAGQPLVRSLGERVLRAGMSLLVTSTGAFTDDELLRRLRGAAEAEGGGRLLLAGGAMPGLDWMQAVAIGAGAEASVQVTQSKPPQSWASCGDPETEAAVAVVSAGGAGAAEGRERGQDEAAAAAAAWAEHGPLTLFEGMAREAVRAAAHHVPGQGASAGP